MNTALGLIIDAAYQGITGTEYVLEPFGFALVNPAALHPHALDGSHVSPHVEFAKKSGGRSGVARTDTIGSLQAGGKHFDVATAFTEPAVGGNVCLD